MGEAGGDFNIATCPICRRSSIGVYRDPTASAPRWYCPCCRTSLTGLQLYTRLRDIPTLRDGLTALAHEADPDPNPVAIDGLFSTYQQEMLVHETLGLSWDWTKTRMKVWSSESLVAVLQDIGAWSSGILDDYENQWSSTFRTLNTQQGQALIRLCKRAGGGILRAKDLAVFPMEVTPGQPVGYFVVDTAGRRTTMRAYKSETVACTGLFGLSDVALNQGDVLHFPTWESYVQARTAWLTYHTSVPPIVGNAHPGATVAWEAVRAQRVVFVCVEGDADSVRQAIAQRDRGFIYEVADLDGRLVVDCAPDMFASAVHWTTYVKNSLIRQATKLGGAPDCGVRADSARETIDQVLQACETEEERKILDRFFAPSQRIHTVRYKDKVYATKARMPGIFLLDPAGDTRISTVTIRLARLVEDERGHDHYFVVVGHSDGEFTFCGRADDLRTRLPDLVDAEMVRRGLPRPTLQVDVPWMSLLTQLYRPPRSTAIGRVGWNRTTGRWNLPRATVGTTGVAEPAKEVVGLPSHPLYSVTPDATGIPLRDISTILTDAPDAVAAWAVLLALSVRSAADFTSSRLPDLVIRADDPGVDVVWRAWTIFGGPAIAPTGRATVDHLTTELDAQQVDHVVPTLVRPKVFPNSAWCTWLSRRHEVGWALVVDSAYGELAGSMMGRSVVLDLRLGDVGEAKAAVEQVARLLPRVFRQICLSPVPPASVQDVVPLVIAAAQPYVPAADQQKLEEVVRAAARRITVPAKCAADRVRAAVGELQGRTPDELDPRTIEQVLSRRGIPVPDWVELLNELEESSRLGTSVVEDQQGVLRFPAA